MRHGPAGARRGNCYNNAQAESYWSRLKTELLDGGSFPNLEEARFELAHYIAHYIAHNEGRHSDLITNHLIALKPNFKQRPKSVHPQPKFFPGRLHF
ncbi:transposase [Hymenobacter sp. BT664]|uniref:Transposase n=1 Tax=Hymenobacter montanus TaxID=2771359 RepID=A0A927BC83_9BACT|nr:transposase [Hymenobacter montanus]